MIPIKDLLESKKFLASCLASIIALVGILNGLSIAEIGVIISPLGAYTLSQGIADMGKEATKVEVNQNVR